MTGAVNWRQRAREALGRTEIMVLATVDADSGTWTSPVQFQAGEAFGLSFLSHPGTRHGDASDGWQRYTVRPGEVWCFDSRTDHERHQVGIR